MEDYPSKMTEIWQKMNTFPWEENEPFEEEDGYTDGSKLYDFHFYNIVWENEEEDKDNDDDGNNDEEEDDNEDEELPDEYSSHMYASLDIAQTKLERNMERNMESFEWEWKYSE